MQSPGGAIRSGRYKLLEYFENGTIQLFDLEADRGEQHDVASEHPEVVKYLMAMFEKTRAEVPKLPPSSSDYLFIRPEKGHPRTLMRLIGGELRYDRIPEPQRHLVVP